MALAQKPLPKAPKEYIEDLSKMQNVYVLTQEQSKRILSLSVKLSLPPSRIIATLKANTIRPKGENDWKVPSERLPELYNNIAVKTKEVERLRTLIKEKPSGFKGLVTSTLEQPEKMLKYNEEKMKQLNDITKILEMFQSDRDLLNRVNGSMME